ncbi:MAG TPA: glycerophosphodiester phosphodiesterase, partial [Ilumatobacteraceae bacterium]
KPAVASGEPTPLDPSNPFRTGHTLVIPHNGGDGLYPEDTMLAFEKTIALGADVVDADLQLTADNVVIAFHDPTVNRTTGSTGDVQKMTYAQLSTLDAGWGFSPGDADGKPTGAHPFRGTGVRIPTLESVLQRFPMTLISLDLKDESTAMVHPLCALLVKYDRLNDVFVGSNSDAQIIDFRKECPTVRTSAIMADVYASRDAQASGDKTFVPAVTVDQPPYRSGNRVLVTKDSLAWAHAHGVAILTWVVNDPADMKLLISLGVDGIYTSYPDRLLKLLGRCVAPC